MCSGVNFLPAGGVAAPIAEPLLGGVAVDHTGRIMDAAIPTRQKQQHHIRINYTHKSQRQC